MPVTLRPCQERQLASIAVGQGSLLGINRRRTIRTGNNNTPTKKKPASCHRENDFMRCSVVWLIMIYFPHNRGPLVEYFCQPIGVSGYGPLVQRRFIYAGCPLIIMREPGIN